MTSALKRRRPLRRNGSRIKRARLDIRIVLYPRSALKLELVGGSRDVRIASIKLCDLRPDETLIEVAARPDLHACHSLLSREARAALTLRLVGGLTTEEQEVLRGLPRQPEFAAHQPADEQPVIGVESLARAANSGRERPRAPARRRSPALADSRTAPSAHRQASSAHARLSASRRRRLHRDGLRPQSGAHRPFTRPTAKARSGSNPVGQADWF
jgi:hypothetical protein